MVVGFNGDGDMGSTDLVEFVAELGRTNCPYGQDSRGLVSIWQSNYRRNQMMRKIVPLILILLLLASTAVGQNHVEIIFEDYNDQDTFNNFSGNWDKWENSPGSLNWSFDIANSRAGHGTCLRVDYSVPNGGYAGLWNSFIGKETDKYMTNLRVHFK